MFGTVMINKPELKIREFERYRGFYCGLCRCLRQNNGRMSQMTLTYDMTFLIVLLSSLYEPKENEERHRCMIHLGKKQCMIQNEITQYASDMNVLLAYYHFLDDWQDEKSIKGLCASHLFQRKAKKIAGKYPNQAETICQKLNQLQQMEKQGETNPDFISKPFAELMAELFIYQEDAFSPILRRFGFFLGKYIYLLDAYMDVEKDEKNHSFNPFSKVSKEDGFEKNRNQILEGTLRSAIVEFEKLPLEQDVPLLRNILYEGVRIPWKKSQKKENNND